MTTTTTLDLREHASTDEAYSLSVSGNENEARWIPKSLCTKIGDGRFEIQRWKAKESGLLVDVNPAKQMRLF